MSNDREPLELTLKDVEFDQRNSALVYHAVIAAINRHGLGEINLFSERQKINPNATSRYDLFDPNIFFYNILFDSAQTRETFEAIVDVITEASEHQPDLQSYERRSFAQREANNIAHLIAKPKTA